MSTDSGVTRVIPVVPFPVGQGSQLGRGNVVEWNGSLQQVRAWSSGSVPAFGVCTGSADVRLEIIDVYCAKGCSVLIKCAPGIIPNPNDFLFWAAPGVVSNDFDGHPPFARAIGVGMNSMVESIIL